jgi:hypothetical protein
MTEERSYPPDHLHALKQDRRAIAGRKRATRAHRSCWSCRRRSPPPPDGDALIDGLVREGARRMLAEPMLAEAMQAEVDNYIARFTTERDEHGRRLVVRSGSHQPRGLGSDRCGAAQRSTRHQATAEQTWP